MALDLAQRRADQRADIGTGGVSESDDDDLAAEAFEVKNLAALIGKAEVVDRQLHFPALDGL